ncbi:hypothetical protein PAMA_021503 [Pampus argenteus]
MSSAKPYIGCKIGLISKAQNRYEGILYTIDKVNSTVVLAKVKCFGTEGRPTDRPTPFKDDIYEYITFRGSDIKDITLCEPPRSYHGLPPDPAIVQSSVGSSGPYSALGPFSPLRMPAYNQFAASSLLNQQYAAALGLDGNHEVGEKDGEESHSNAEDYHFGPKCYYDKTKSFFDNISSEIKFRLTWAEERKRNLETFGVPGRFLRGQGFRGGYIGRRGRGAAQTLPSLRARSGQL